MRTRSSWVRLPDILHLIMGGKRAEAGSPSSDDAVEHILPVDPVAIEILPQTIRVVDPLLERARSRVEGPAGLGERARSPTDFDHLAELHALDAVHRLEPL